MRNPNQGDSSSDQSHANSDVKTSAHPLTIAELVEENHNLITVLGVFVALTIFSTNLPLQPFGYILSFLFMLAAIQLWWEFIGRFPPQRGSQELYWFENVLSYALLVFVTYWFIQYRKAILQLIALPIALLLNWIISLAIKRHDAFNRFFDTTAGEHKALRRGCWIFLVWLSISLAYLIQILLSPHLLPLLDTLSDALQNMRI